MKYFFDVFFYNSFVMSVFTLCFLLTFKFLQKRYSAKWLYSILIFITALWVFSFRPQIELPTVLSQTVDTVPVLLPSMFEEITEPSKLTDMVINTGGSLSLWVILCVLWIIGIVAISLYYVIRHNRFIRFINRWSAPITDSNTLQLFDRVKEEVGIKKQLGIKECKSIGTPMLIGLCSPTILLPSRNFTEFDLYYILKHECIHYRQKDLYWKLLVLFATILHWFNPIVWLMTKTIAFQCELACDEKVITDLDFGKRKEYGKTIINAIRSQINHKPILSTNFYGGKQDMKTRIFSIMDKNKKKSGLSIISILLIGLIFTSCSIASEPEALVGYIVLEENTLYLDEVEVITIEDKDRIAELALKDGDMPNGYYIHNPSTERKSFELTDKTAYTFTDFNLLFVEDAEGDRLYTTSKKENFIQHLKTSYSDEPPAQKVPFFIEVKDGKVISITEKFLFTQ